MRYAADCLRWALVAMQCALLAWMIASGLWRKLPLWCAWLAAEALSRAIFSPSGGYWHSLWLPLQPSILFLLAAAAVEARWQAGARRANMIATAALCVAPAGLLLNVRDMAEMRALLNVTVAFLLIGCVGTFTARWHARILALLAGCTAALGWMPATGAAWWSMRVAYLAVACGCAVAWGWLLIRRGDAARPRSLAAAR